MPAAAVIALITALLSSAPEAIADVEKLVGDLKSGAQPLAPLAPEVHAALDDLHQRIMLAALAAQQKG